MEKDWLNPNYCEIYLHDFSKSFVDRPQYLTHVEADKFMVNNVFFFFFFLICSIFVFPLLFPLLILIFIFNITPHF